jgi:hypothetical protein
MQFSQHPLQFSQHPSQSWPHPSQSWPKGHPQGPQSWDHHHHHPYWGGRPYYGWETGPGYYYPDYGYDYGYDDGYDDGYYPTYPSYAGSNAHVRWCEAHYKTYNPATDLFFVRRGVPARCVAPFDRP